MTAPSGSPAVLGEATDRSEAHEPDRAAPATVAPLWRNWRFQLIWIGSTTGFLGVAIADFAYPLVILAITGSPATAALFAFIQTSFSIAAGLPAGALVDRLDRRRVLIGVETFRAVASASVFAAWALGGHVTVAHLMVVAAALGAATPLGATARMLVVRAVVPPAQLTAALTQDEVRTAAGGLAGPPIGGVLLAASRGLPFLVSSLTFVISLLTALIVRIPTADRAATSDRAAGAERSGALSGLADMWRNPVVRTTVAMISIINIGGNALFLSVVVLLTGQGASARAIGIAVAGEAVGNLLGAAFVGRLHKRFAPGQLLIFVGTVLTVGVALLAVPLGPWWIFGVLAFSMLGVPSIRVLLDVLILRQVPDERRGRTIATVMTLFTLGMPFGTIAGGLALQFLGATTTIILVAAVCAASALLGVATRELRQARWPVAG